MKAVLIDDETPALQQMERLLTRDGRIEIAGLYLTAGEGLEHLSKERVDVVFLDIGMPVMNGLEAGEYIQQLDPTIRIVYVTAYAEYAIEAFELYALDYILKPVLPARLQKTIERLLLLYPPETDAEEKAEVNKIVLFMFKRLGMKDSKGQEIALKWRTAKSRELFAFLLHHQGDWVPKERIIEEIWSRYPSEKAITHLHTAVYQLRKMLKEAGEQLGIEFAHDSYRIQIGPQVVTDVQQFAEGLQSLEQNLETAGAEWMRKAENILGLYQGDYLEDYSYGWAKPAEIRLQEQYLRLNMQLADREAAEANVRSALERLLSIQDKVPYSDSFCRTVMSLYASLGEYAMLQIYYEGYQRHLEKELGIQPEESTRRLYETWRNRQ